MRTDTNVARQSFRFSRQWRRDGRTGTDVPEIDRRLSGGQVVNGRFVAHSLSGHERNHLFFNGHGDLFTDISTISGMDNPADSRGFVLWDYNHDGWQDVALVNANAPLLNLYRNDIGRATPNGGERGGMIALRFVGGSTAPTTSSFACRDGYGAIVTVELEKHTLKREHRCGEGYASQNSSTLVVGIGDSRTARSVVVRWPSGVSHRTENVPEGCLLTVFENPEEAPTGEPFLRQEYRSREPGGAPLNRAPRTSDEREFVVSGRDSLPRSGPANVELRVYTTMATWCLACKQHLPQLRRLQAALGDGAIELIGVPIDENDSTEKLTDYFTQWQPPYRLLLELTPQERSLVNSTLDGVDVLPSTIVTDAAGRVLYAGSGVPSVSDLLRLRWQMTTARRISDP